MKLCPGCHQETFDGRATCHRCGRDVSEVQQLALPSSDPATLVRWLPFTSKKGALELDARGVRFVSTSGDALLAIATSELQSVDPRGSTELQLSYQRDGRRSSARVRVRWAPRADRSASPLRHELVVVSHTWRPVTFGGNTKRRTMRDREVVRDRWLYTLRRLLTGDRYALGRSAASPVESGL